MKAGLQKLAALCAAVSVSVAAILCACGHSVTVEEPAPARVAIADAHACCKAAVPEPGGPDSSAPLRHDPHDPGCRHCASPSIIEAGRAQAPMALTVAVLLQTPFAYVSPRDQALDGFAQGRLTARNLPPPPDRPTLLSLSCALTI